MISPIFTPISTTPRATENNPLHKEFRAKGMMFWKEKFIEDPLSGSSSSQRSLEVQTFYGCRNFFPNIHKLDVLRRRLLSGKSMLVQMEKCLNEESPFNYVPQNNLASFNPKVFSASKTELLQLVLTLKEYGLNIEIAIRAYMCFSQGVNEVFPITCIDVLVSSYLKEPFVESFMTLNDLDVILKEGDYLTYQKTSLFALLFRYENDEAEKPLILKKSSDFINITLSIALKLLRDFKHLRFFQICHFFMSAAKRQN